MAIFKCKMCGGDLEINDTDKVIECEYCGTNQTVPSADNEKKLNLFNRANRLRINGEFDKATAIYENIVAEFPEEAEAYWGLVICNYGIEYVDDPATARKIPTCHRASFESIQNDENFNMALEYADVVAQKIYRDEAREIDRIREEILAVSRNEQPYDIFICYKESAEDGERTIDSVIAQDLYDTLTDKGYKVFFARISLEDKLGSKYEPYIFAALNSAKIMLSIGTKYEYFHAVWVKNEWSRFLKLMAKDKSKVLIPCYKDMDAYDMPDEFKALQAQDLGKVGAIQDLVRGISKILGSTEKSQTVTVAPTTTGALTKRGYIFLEDGEYAQADSYFDKALDENPEDAKAYLGKVLSSLNKSSVEELTDTLVDLNSFKDFERAIRFSSDEEKATLESIKENTDKKYLIKCLTVGINKYLSKSEKQLKKEEAKRLADEAHELASQATVESFEKIVDIYTEAYNRNLDIDLFGKSELDARKRQLQIIKFLSASGEAYSKYEVEGCKYFSGVQLNYDTIEKELEKMVKEGSIEHEHVDGRVKYCIKGGAEIRAAKIRANGYKFANDLMNNASSDKDYFKCVQLFEKLIGYYDDAEQKKMECERLAQEAILKREKELAEAEKMKKIQRKNYLEQELSKLRTELLNVKGLFSGRKKRDIEEHILSIEKELSSMK